MRRAAVHHGRQTDRPADRATDEVTAMATEPAKYRIHPAIGIARVGDSPDEFYIAPDQPAAKPIDCDRRGNPRLSPDGTKELPVTHFKDVQGRIKRQAARFQIYAYDDANPQGRALVLGDDVEGGGNRGKLVDIIWQVYPRTRKRSGTSFAASAVRRVTRRTTGCAMPTSTTPAPVSN
jgi:L-Lysine epsilon oxidase N-terminal